MQRLSRRAVRPTRAGARVGLDGEGCELARRCRRRGPVVVEVVKPHGTAASEKETLTEMDRGLSVLIADGESDFALPVLRCLSRAPGVTVDVLSEDPRPPVRYSRHRGRFIATEAQGDDETRLRGIRAAIRSCGAEILMPVGAEKARFVAAHRSALEGEVRLVPLPDAETLERADDKGLFAEFLRSHGLPCPSTVRCKAGAFDATSFSSLSFPVLVKPARGGFGRGIRLFERLETLMEYVESRAERDELIVQSRVRGGDVDCSLLARDGRILAYTIQRPIVPGVRAFGAPLAIEFVHDDAVREVVERLVRALRWSGIAHVDLRYDEAEGGVKVIELNPRYWGSLLGSLVAGVNFPHLACLAAVGREFPEPEYRGVRYCGGKTAVRLLARRLKGRGGSALGIEETGLGFTLRDPGPQVLGPLAEILGRGRA